MPGWMVRVNDILKQLGSHNLLATPASADFNDEVLKPLLTEYLRGAENTGAEERARLFRTAWDFAGSALGGRVELYERFYLASAPRNYSIAHMLAQTPATGIRSLSFGKGLTKSQNLTGSD